MFIYVTCVSVIARKHRIEARAYLSEADDHWLERAVLFGCFQRLVSAGSAGVGEAVGRGAVKNRDHQKHR